MANRTTDRDPCVVVRARPVGLIAALALARKGLSVVALEFEPPRPRKPRMVIEVRREEVLDA
jgi:2-polyprenyl-6-methoxyphenol hydroxylase-like FAD-dependent oxidoreductase